MQGKEPYGHRLQETQKEKEEGCPKRQQPTQKKTYIECGTCGKTDHPEERCWQGAGAHLKPKPTRPDDSSDNNPNSKSQKSVQLHIVQLSILIQKGGSKLLANHQVPIRRQYVRSHPPTKVFHEYRQQLMGYPSVVWQQQMGRQPSSLTISPICTKNQFLFGTLILPQTSLPGSGPFS